MKDRVSEQLSAMTDLKKLKSWKCFGGFQNVYSHFSESTQTDMEFSVYLPPQTESENRPVLFWLSGLTCTWENFTAKAGAQRYAAEHGLILVAPDTSPRGLDLPGEHDSYDFGSGAGFYLDAIIDPWRRHYNMGSYITQELVDTVAKHFPVKDDSMAISGHSMGGHGALICALKNPHIYTSVSAFAPIVNPSDVPWGQKAFRGYLGRNKKNWEKYDATHLVGNSDWKKPVLIDQGTADQFLDEQLQPEVFARACEESGIKLELRRQDGYDHSYYTIATFIGDHIKWHAEALK